jgi:hypothetical protein
MKLRANNDIEVYNKIAAWVAIQQTTKQITQAEAPTCRTASSILITRLSRSFEQRHASSKQEGGQNVKNPGKAQSVSEPCITGTDAPHTSTNATNTNDDVNGGNKIVSTTATADATPVANDGIATKIGAQNSTNASKAAQSKTTTANLEDLMRRKVKVTKLVQKDVEFIGSDLLKVLQVMVHSPTVADVVDNCIGLLATQDRIKEVYTILETAHGKKPDGIDESSAVFFGVFALQSLQALRSQAICTYELAYDFDFIYDSCYQNHGFKACANALNPTSPPPTVGGPAPPYFAPDTEARNICWKLARVLALKQDYATMKTDPEGKQRRRNHIVSSAACILFAASLGQAKLAAKKAVDDTAEPSAKKQKTEDAVVLDYALTTDYIELMSTPMSDLKTLIENDTYSGTEFTPVTSAEIRSYLAKIFSLLGKNALVQTTPASDEGNVQNGSSQVSKAFSSPKLSFMLKNYRAIIHKLVLETQQNLNITISPENGTIESASTPSTFSGGAVRTAIANVIMLFPMVVGEPWGIHRDAPLITSSLLCRGYHTKPSEEFKDSVAVVLTLKSRELMQKKPHQPGPEGTMSLSKTSATTHPKKPGAASPTARTQPDASKDHQDQEMKDALHHPPSRQPTLINMGEIEPPVINDSMELNEWTLSILSLSVIKPSDSLLMFLGDSDRKHGNDGSCLHDVIVPVLNRGLLRLQGMIRTTKGPSPLVSKNTRLTVGRKDGQVYVNGQVDEAIQLCASVVGFYYHSLEAIIRDQIERMEFLGSFGALLHSESFHRALLTCCYACVQKGVGKTQKLDMTGAFKETTVSFLLETIESSPYTFLKVTEVLRRALVVTADPSKRKIGSPIVPGLPAILQQHLQKIEVQLVDSVVWGTPSTSKSEGSLALTIKTMKALPGAWPPDVLEPTLPEELVDMEGDLQAIMTDVKYKPPFTSSSEANFLSYVLRKLIKIVFFRVQAIFAALKMSKESLVHTQFLIAFRYLLRHHFEIFFDRHIDQLLLCTIYGVCRAMDVQPEVTFGKIMDAYIAIRKKEAGERACRVILRHVKLVSSENDFRPGDKVVGNLIVFYNQVYVPRMQKHFNRSKSLQHSTVEYRKKLEDERSDSHHPASSSKPPNPNGISVASGPMLADAAKTTNDKPEWDEKDNEKNATSSCNKQNTSAGNLSVSWGHVSVVLERTVAPTSSPNPSSTDNTDPSNQGNDANTKGSSSEVAPVVVVAKSDCGKEVQVTQKESVDSTEATSNGSQKRSFSTI